MSRETQKVAEIINDLDDDWEFTPEEMKKLSSLSSEQLNTLIASETMLGEFIGRGVTNEIS